MKILRPLAMLLCATALAGCDSPRTQLKAHDIEVTADSLASLSAEAALLARELGLHSVSDNFAWVHQQAMAEQSLTLARQLAKPAPLPLRVAHERLGLLNARFQAGVNLIASASAQPAELARLQQDFSQLSAQAKTMGQRP